MEEDSPPQTVEYSPPVSRDIIVAPDPAIRFKGLGTNFRAKLIGIDDVADSRGDQMCQESILKLKAAVQASGRHKQKIIVNVSLEGIKIVDILSGEVQHVHPVHRISFIARDLTDRRAFGYVYGAGEGRHQFFGIKTAKVAEVLVLALRDLFQVVYDMKKKEIEEAKTNGDESENMEPRQITIITNSQNPPLSQPPPPVEHSPQNDGNLFDLEQQLTTIQEGINNIDAIGPWPQDMPTSPDTPGGDTGSDLFGIANLSDISSLSSDFSCTSNVILDYGHTGGGNHNQFERSGSSRSSTSCQGMDYQSFSWSSSYSNKNSKLLSLPHDSSVHKSSQTTEKTGEGKEDSQTISKSDSILEVYEPKTVTNDKGKDNDDNDAQENSGIYEPSSVTLDGTSSIGSLPWLDKGSKKHGSSFFSRSKKSTRKPKVKNEKNSEKKKYHDTSTNALPITSYKTSHVVAKVSEVRTGSNSSRRESMSSVSSVRSCIIPTTTHNMDSSEKSKSRSSLNEVWCKSDDSKHGNAEWHSKNYEPRTSSEVSFIVPSSICPRTRPKGKDPVQVMNNDSCNPPMFKKHHMSPNLSDLRNPSPSRPKPDENESDGLVSASSPVSWNTSFDVDFEHLIKGKKHKPTGAELLDPFTGLAREELKLSSLTSSTFEETFWNDMNAADKLNTRPGAESDGKSQSLQAFVEDFSSDPFSSADISSPFDGLDPFADSLKNEDPFSVCGNSGLEAQCFETKEDFRSNFLGRLSFSDPRETYHAPHEIPTSTSEDSPYTSGMSTPLGTQSPVRNATSLPSSSHPPVIPPRLPPRPNKKNSSECSSSPSSDCPNIPPPPLPQCCLTSSSEYRDGEVPSEDEAVVPKNVAVSALKRLQNPPAIPARIFLPSGGQRTESKEDVDCFSLFNDKKLQSNSSNNVPKQTSSYSDELFDLASPVAQPVPQPGAKLTKEQILSSYGGAAQQGMFPGQAGMMMAPGQAQMAFNLGYQQMQAASQALPVMGVFPSGPSPAIPPRPGAMRPNTPQPLTRVAPQNPFGDSAPTESVSMLSPMTSENKQELAGVESTGKSDPFASLVPGMGSSGVAAKKDMFKNYQMAKPPQPPPRTNLPLNTSNDVPANAPEPQQASNFENYFLNSVGGVPVAEEFANNNPVAAPRKQVNDSDPFGLESGAVNQPTAADPFGPSQTFSQPFEFNQAANNSQSLFG